MTNRGMIAKIKNLLRPLIRPPLHKTEITQRYHVYGTEYGAWPIIKDSLQSSDIVYSFGVGEDISFDLEAISKHGVRVYAYDPTPKSKRWLSKQSLPDRFIFSPVGISSVDGEVEFFAPANTEHVSFSSSPGDGQNAPPIVAEVKRLSTLMRENAHDGIAVLKMDIEGFEYGVIDDFVSSEARPRQLLVEFHHDMYGYSKSDTLRAVSSLRYVGYKIFYISSGGREYGFVHV